MTIILNSIAITISSNRTSTKNVICYQDLYVLFLLWLTAYSMHNITEIIQRTSSGTAKFCSSTLADQSPLIYSVVHKPSVSMVTGTVSINPVLQESSVPLVNGTASLNSSLQQSRVSSTCNCSLLSTFTVLSISIYVVHYAGTTQKSPTKHTW